MQYFVLFCLFIHEACFIRNLSHYLSDSEIEYVGVLVIHENMDNSCFLSSCSKDGVVKDMISVRGRKPLVLGSNNTCSSVVKDMISVRGRKLECANSCKKVESRKRHDLRKGTETKFLAQNMSMT